MWAYLLVVKGIQQGTGLPREPQPCSPACGPGAGSVLAAAGAMPKRVSATQTLLAAISGTKPATHSCSCMLDVASPGQHAPRAHPYLPPACPQVLLLSGGLMLYQGSTPGLLPWFSAQLGYHHQAALQGSVSDWALDLVAVGFDKPKVSCSGHWLLAGMPCV